MMSELNILLAIEAFLIGFFLYRFQIMHNFVDNRKSVLRDSLRTHILNEPYLLTLIQNIGKNQKVMYYFGELVGGIHPAYEDIVKEIIVIRQHFSKVWIGFFITSFIILIIIVLSATRTNYESNYDIIIAIILMCFIIFLFSYLIYSTRLKDSNYSSSIVLYNSLDHFIAYLYKDTYKDRLSILSDDDISKRRFEKRYNQIIEEIMNYQNHYPQKNIRILDLGCGDGLLPKYLNNRFFYDGIDISEKSIEKAKKINSKNENANFNVSNLFYNISLNNKYDIIILLEILEHYFLPENILKIVKEHLKDEGIVIATLPNIRNQYNRKIASQTIPKSNCRDIMSYKVSNYNFIEHHWIDKETNIYFPHMLYSIKKAEILFNKVFKYYKIKVDKNFNEESESIIILAH